MEIDKNFEEHHAHLIVEVLAIMNHLSPHRWNSMVKFVQHAFDSVRVLDKGLFEQCTQQIQMMVRMVDWLI